ncbi:MAG: agmatinase [bacterium]
MLKGPFLSRNWLGACENFENSDWVLVGLPYDGTCSFKPGTRFGPEMIRIASQGIETYSMYQNKDLSEIAFYDAGDLEFPFGDKQEALNRIAQATRETLDFQKHWLGIGGEHLVTYPAVKTYLNKYPDLIVLHFDAHADLRENYLGETFSHATVMRQISNLIGPQRIIQIGIRSGVQEEFEWMNNHSTLFNNKSQIPAILEKISDHPVFLTIDLDVLDPGIMSGVGTPEPGGMSFNELIFWLLSLKNLNYVGADIVELSPHYDISGVSAITAAKIIREILLLSV